MGITIYTMGGEGEILEEEWQRGIQTSKKVITSDPSIGRPSNITHSASINKIIDTSISGATDVANKLTQGVIESEADVVRQAMQNWASQFDQGVQEEIQKSTMFQQSQTEDPVYEKVEGGKRTMMGGEDLTGEQQSGMLDRQSIEELVRRSLVIDLDPEARIRYDSKDPQVYNNIEGLVRSGVDIILNSANPFDEYNKLRTKVAEMERRMEISEFGPGGGLGPGGVGMGFGDPNAEDVRKEIEDITSGQTGGGVGTPASLGRGSYSLAPWDSVYRTFLDANIGGDPQAYKVASQKGVGGDPLQRTVYTQFLIQATEDDPWGGSIMGGDPDTRHGEVYSGLGKTDPLDPDVNPYADFLSSFKPLSGDRLMNTIDDVITTMRTFTEDTDLSENAQYSAKDLRNFRWRDRFRYSTNADQNQQALAALPILDNSPAVLRGETSSILQRLHNRWTADPNRDADESWLEYVDRNNYFGMLPKTTRDIRSGADTGG